MLKTLMVKSGLIAALCSISVSLYAIADSPKQINVPAGDLVTALEILAKQADVEFVYQRDQLKGFHTQGVNGNLLAKDAVKKLLEGTQLRLRTDTTGAMLITPIASHNTSSSSVGQVPPQAFDPVNNGKTQGKKSSSDPFRVAQVDQGASASAAAVTTESQSAESKNALEEIVVTAQRRRESLDRVPISVTALSQQAMDELHVQSFGDLASIVPGLVIPPVGGLVQSLADVAIRGILSGGNAATTGIYIDETPIVVRRNLSIGYSGSPQPDVFDLERVEVLRGPQGTLFGSGAMGGAIRYITPQPNLHTASGYSKVELTETDRGAPSYAVGAAYGAPVVAGVAAFRLSAWFHSDGGFVDIEDPYTGQIVKRNANSSDSYVLRPAFTFVPTDALTMTAAVFLQRHHSDAPEEYWLNELPNPESGARATGFGARVPQPVADNLTVSSLAIKYEFAGLSLQSDTSYTNRTYHDYDDWSNFIPTFFGVAPTDPALAAFSAYDSNIASTKAWQQEFRLSSQDPSARLTWVAGAYYRRATDVLSQLIGPDLTPVTELASGQTSLEAFNGVPAYVFNGQPLAAYAWSSTTTDQRALFGEVAFNILPRLKANVGIRVERSAIEGQRQIFAGPFDGTAYSNVVLPDERDTPITPRFGITYQYADQHMIYATAAKGYRAGGTNALLANSDPLCGTSLAALGLKAAPITFSSDSLWSYEVGAKDSFFERRLAVQTSVYYIDWSGIQTQLQLPSCGQFFTANQGKAISQGFDLQLAAVVMDGLKVSGNVGYDKAYYPRALYGAPSDGGAPPLVIGAGDRLAIPPWSASLHVDYSLDIGRLWNGARSYIRADYRWLDAYPAGNPKIVNYDPAVGSNPNQSYGMLNIRLGVLHEGLDISAFVDNATNANPRLDFSDGAVASNPLHSATAIRPLTAGITALYRF